MPSKPAVDLLCQRRLYTGLFPSTAASLGNPGSAGGFGLSAPSQHRAIRPSPSCLCWGKVIVVLVCISLPAKDVEYLFLLIAHLCFCFENTIVFCQLIFFSLSLNRSCSRLKLSLRRHRDIKTGRGPTLHHASFRSDLRSARHLCT